MLPQKCNVALFGAEGSPPRLGPRRLSFAFRLRSGRSLCSSRSLSCVHFHSPQTVQRTLLSHLVSGPVADTAHRSPPPPPPRNTRRSPQPPPLSLLALRRSPQPPRTLPPPTRRSTRHQPHISCRSVQTATSQQSTSGAQDRKEQAGRPLLIRASRLRTSSGRRRGDARVGTCSLQTARALCLCLLWLHLFLSWRTIHQTRHIHTPTVGCANSRLHVVLWAC